MNEPPEQGRSKDAHTHTHTQLFSATLKYAIITTYPCKQPPSCYHTPANTRTAAFSTRASFHLCPVIFCYYLYFPCSAPLTRSNTHALDLYCGVVWGFNLYSQYRYIYYLSDYMYPFNFSCRI